MKNCGIVDDGVAVVSCLVAGQRVREGKRCAGRCIMGTAFVDSSYKCGSIRDTATCLDSNNGRLISNNRNKHQIYILLSG